jgi:hypothetical protein
MRTRDIQHEIDDFIYFHYLKDRLDAPVLGKQLFTALDMYGAEVIVSADTFMMCAGRRFINGKEYHGPIYVQNQAEQIAVASMSGFVPMRKEKEKNVLYRGQRECMCAICQETVAAASKDS